MTFRLVDQLGARCAPALCRATTRRLLSLTAEHHALYSCDGGGAHIVVARDIYTHHGIYLGRGTVIHYTGEAEEKHAAQVRLGTLGDFAHPQSPAVIKEIKVRDSFRNLIPTVSPGLAQLHAFSCVGELGYHLVGRNCEHLAFRSQLNVHFSGQIARRINSAILAALGSLTPAAETLVLLGLLGVKFGHRTGPALKLTEPAISPHDLQIHEPQPPEWLDLARAFWDSGLRRVVVWFPLWAPGREGVGSANRPWGVRDSGGRWVWEKTDPRSRAHSSTVARLIWVHGEGPAGAAHWIDDDNHWVQAEPDLLGLGARLNKTHQVLTPLLA